MVRSTPMLSLLFVAACSAAPSAAITPATTTSAPAPAPSATCIPLLTTVGVALPEGWSAERRGQGEYLLELADRNDSIARHASVATERVARCTPTPSPDAPLDAAFPLSYETDAHRTTSTVDGLTTAKQACVHGDDGALLVTIHSYQPSARAALQALLTRLAESTDGRHRCQVL